MTERNTPKKTLSEKEIRQKKLEDRLRANISKRKEQQKQRQED